MRIKSAALAAFLLLLMLATGGCSKNKKPEETPATTSTAASPSTAATPAPATGTATTESAQTPPPAPAPEETPKPPAVKKRVARKHVAPKPVATEAPAEPAVATEPAVPKTFTLPQGTVLTVRLNESVSSKSNHTGDTFTAVIEEPVEVDGKVAVPKGSSASGTVTEAKARGKIKGSATLRLVLDSITIKDKEYDIRTTAVAREMEGKGKRTAAIGGGGAATGAIVGAVAGGAKGFGIGMLVGAGVGLAGGAFTGNKNIEHPAETVLSFKLLKPVDVRR